MDLDSILVGCALQKESKQLGRRLPQLPPACLLVTGLGARRTAVKLTRSLQRCRPAVFIFTGTAGQLDPGLPMGTVLCPQYWRTSEGFTAQATPELVAKAKDAGISVVPLGLTVRLPVIGPQQRRALFTGTGASICDMEAATALATAAALGIPAMALKVISDTAESGITGFWSFFDRNMEHLARALHPLLETL